MLWDDLIKAVNKAETKIQIQEIIYLNQRSFKKKKTFQMSLNLCNNYTEKTEIAFPQTKTSFLMFCLSEAHKKATEKARKEKKEKYTKKTRQTRKKRQQPYFNRG